MTQSSDLGLAISSTGMLIVAARRNIRQLVAGRISRYDLTPHQFWMVLVLAKAAPLSLGELARAMWMDNPTISRMVQLMQQRGFLTVGPDPAHGRRIQIRLSPEGLTLAAELAAIGEDLSRGAQAGLSEEEAATLHGLLCRVLRNLDDLILKEAPAEGADPAGGDVYPSVS